MGSAGLAPWRQWAEHEAVGWSCSHSCTEAWPCPSLSGPCAGSAALLGPAPAPPLPCSQGSVSSTIRLPWRCPDPPWLWTPQPCPAPIFLQAAGSWLWLTLRLLWEGHGAGSPLLRQVPAVLQNSLSWPQDRAHEAGRSVLPQGPPKGEERAQDPEFTGNRWGSAAGGGGLETAPALSLTVRHGPYLLV